jgi:hypothetical protein
MMVHLKVHTSEYVKTLQDETEYQQVKYAGWLWQAS